MSAADAPTRRAPPAARRKPTLPDWTWNALLAWLAIAHSRPNQAMAATRPSSARYSTPATRLLSTADPGSRSGDGGGTVTPSSVGSAANRTYVIRSMPLGHLLQSWTGIRP